jgi:hypothetical protein
MDALAKRSMVRGRNNIVGPAIFGDMIFENYDFS